MPAARSRPRVVLGASFAVLARNLRHHPFYRKVETALDSVGRFGAEAVELYTPGFHLLLNATEELADRYRPDGERHRRRNRSVSSSTSTEASSFLLDDDCRSGISSIATEANLSVREHVSLAASSVGRSASENLLAAARRVVRGSPLVSRLIRYLYHVADNAARPLPEPLARPLRAGMVLFRELLSTSTPPKRPPERYASRAGDKRSLYTMGSPFPRRARTSTGIDRSPPLVSFRA